jgi:hypothetical protein
MGYIESEIGVEWRDCYETEQKISIVPPVERS